MGECSVYLNMNRKSTLISITLLLVSGCVPPAPRNTPTPGAGPRAQPHHPRNRGGSLRRRRQPATRHRQWGDDILPVRKASREVNGAAVVKKFSTPSPRARDRAIYLTYRYTNLARSLPTEFEYFLLYVYIANKPLENEISGPFSKNSDPNWLNPIDKLVRPRP